MLSYDELTSDCITSKILIVTFIVILRLLCVWTVYYEYEIIIICYHKTLKGRPVTRWITL